MAGTKGEDDVVVFRRPLKRLRLRRVVEDDAAQDCIEGAQHDRPGDPVDASLPEQPELDASHDGSGQAPAISCPVCQVPHPHQPCLLDNVEPSFPASPSPPGMQPVASASPIVLEQEQANEGAANTATFCPICQDNHTDPAVTECGHVFCWDCLRRHLEGTVRPLCPICRKRLMKKKLIKVFDDIWRKF